MRKTVYTKLLSNVITKVKSLLSKKVTIALMGVIYTGSVHILFIYTYEIVWFDS
jgi:hypothetical protein